MVLLSSDGKTVLRMRAEKGDRTAEPFKQQGNRSFPPMQHQLHFTADEKIKCVPTHLLLNEQSLCTCLSVHLSIP